MDRLMTHTTPRDPPSVCLSSAPFEGSADERQPNPIVKESPHMIDPLFDADMTGTIATSRHEAVRYRAGPSYGETFSEDEHYDGLSLTLEVSGTADAEAMLAAIAKPEEALTLEDGTDVLKLAGFMDACGVENSGSATENEQATSYLFRGATAIRALNAELVAVKKHEKSSRTSSTAPKKRPPATTMTMPNLRPSSRRQRPSWPWSNPPWPSRCSIGRATTSQPSARSTHPRSMPL